MSALPPPPASGWDPFAQYRPGRLAVIPQVVPQVAVSHQVLAPPPPVPAPVTPAPMMPLVPPKPPQPRPPIIPPKPRPPRPKAPASPRIVLRCTPEYHDWVRRLADHLGTTTTTAITAGLMHQADMTGFSRPPRRYARKLDPDLDA